MLGSGLTPAHVAIEQIVCRDASPELVANIAPLEDFRIVTGCRSSRSANWRITGTGAVLF